ncbi:TPA: oligosaccharide flippase family protein [Vibrio vulnificus]|nr:oligosaccharide flippase family protein [Vibrio vulnificus]HDY7496205.1 oligosaccharide flippase family protein [Vibrio vulnificus]
MFKKFLSINILNSVLGILTGIILARNLIPEERGLLGQIVLMSTYAVTISSSSIRDVILTNKMHEKKINIYNVFFSLGLLLFIPTGVLYFYELECYIWFVLLFSLMMYFNSISHALIQLDGSLIKLGGYKIITPFSYMFLISLILMFNYNLSVELILSIILISNAICLLFSFRFLLELEISNYFEKREFKKYIHVLLCMVILILTSQMDKFILPMEMSHEDFGLYLIAFTLVGTPIGILLDSISNYLIVYVKRKDAKRKFFYFIIYYLLFFEVVFVIVLYFISDYLISFVFGDAYSSSSKYIYLCGLFMISNTLRTISTSVLRSLDFNKDALDINFFSLLIALSIAPLAYLATSNIITTLTIVMILSSLVLFLYIHYGLNKKIKME